VYQDANLLVVDKPAGLTVHPAPGHRDGTLVNALLSIMPDLSGIGGELRPGIVHRLDKDTSGLMVVAKNDATHRSLARQLKDRVVQKAYLALVEGNVGRDSGTIHAPIARHPKHRQKMAIVEGGRDAVTEFRVLRRYAPSTTLRTSAYTLVEAHPVTGRTHQIRVHFASIGHPLVGDAVYGKRSSLVERHFLHAARLGFLLPPNEEEKVEFESPLPPDLQAVLDALR
jgi:23S rRNA pseudouridine1911/1915/1917 synthase